MIEEERASVQNEADSGSLKMDEAGQATGSELEKRQEDLLRLRNAVNEDPRNVLLLNQLGLAAEEAGDYTRARWAYRRASRLDPSYGAAYQNLGMLYWREGRSKPAINALENCIKYAGRDCDRQAVETILDDLRQSSSSLAPVQDRDPVDDDARGSARWEAAQTSASRTDSVPQRRPSAVKSRRTSQVQPATINPALTRPLEELNLTPAEALMLLDPTANNGQEMLRYTALDLVNKQVLEVDDRGQISRGQNFQQAPLQRHERLLASYFSRFELGIDLAQYADFILARLDNHYSTFKARYVRQVLLEKGYVTVENDHLWGFIPLRRYVLTPEGSRVMHQLKRQIKISQGQIRRLASRDPELARDYLASAGPALLLLDNYTGDEFQEWHEMLDAMGLDHIAAGSRPSGLPTNASELVEAVMNALSGG